MAHQVHGGFALVQGVKRFLPAISGGIVDETVVFKQLAPLLKDASDPRVIVAFFTQHQVEVELRAIDAHVEIVEPGGGGPAIFGADGDRGDAGFAEGIAEQLGIRPRFRAG